MIDYLDNNQPDKSPINVIIGEQEWADYSFQNKVRLLYRLKQSESSLAKTMVNSISILVEEEQNKNEIDYDATLRQLKDVSEWPE